MPEFFNAGNIKAEVPEIIIGQVVTKPAGSLAKINAKQSGKDVVLNFEIPKGDQGDKGNPGVGISSIDQMFAVSQDGFNHPTNWNSNIQARMFGDHLWSKLTIRMTDSTTKDFYFVLPETPAPVTPIAPVPVTQTTAGTFKLGFNSFNEPDKELVLKSDLNQLKASLETQIQAKEAPITNVTTVSEEDVNELDNKVSTLSSELEALSTVLKETIDRTKINISQTVESNSQLSEQIESIKEQIEKVKKESADQIENQAVNVQPGKAPLFSFSKKIPAIPNGSPDGEYNLVAVVKDGIPSYAWKQR